MLLVGRHELGLNALSGPISASWVAKAVKNTRYNPTSCNADPKRDAAGNA